MDAVWFLEYNLGTIISTLADFLNSEFGLHDYTLLDAWDLILEARRPIQYLSPKKVFCHHDLLQTIQNCLSKFLIRWL